MGSKMNSGGRRTQSIKHMLIVISLCGFFYLLATWQKSGSGKGDTIALEIIKQTDCGILKGLSFETHQNGGGTSDSSEANVKLFKPCPIQYTDHTPCQDEKRAMTFPRENMIYRERHCPSEDEKLHCLIPAPQGYVTPFPWPKSRDYVAYANVPYKSLTIEKAVQSCIHLQGNVFKFPGGGTIFPEGPDAYIDELASVIPIADGTVRTALDMGCGVASWAAYLWERNVITMSFAPRNSHDARVQFALERGVPAVIGVLGTIQLPYPSRSFDMAHCAQCSIPWASNDRMYLMEVDRVLRPGGYWILSGPPINWKTYHMTWNRSKEDLQQEQKKIERLAEILCWEKQYENRDIAIWRKKLNAASCDIESRSFCESKNADDVWYKKLNGCITPWPEVNSPKEVAGGELQGFPDRLYGVPPRILKGFIPGVNAESFQKDNRLWKKHVNSYRRINQLIGTRRYRNLMDMNAGLGGFAAALESPKSWVMNVVPSITDKNTLGVIYERGLIGIYHDWCEAFSTYPRSYDLIHAYGVFSLYLDKCSMEDILLEMDRILRPEGTVIFRDNDDVLNKVMRVASGIRWDTKMFDHEDGPLLPEKILFAVKRYWVGSDSSVI